MSAKKAVILTLGFLLSTAASAAKIHLLQEGFALAGVDGKISNAENNAWLFEPDSDLNDGREIVKAGTAVELLPSAGLEKMAADAKSRTALHYRLWGRVTKEGDRNFIFPTYFLPLSKSGPPRPPAGEQGQPQKEPAKQQEQQEVGPTINEPNDVLVLPQEVLNKLATRQTVRIEQVERVPQAPEMEKDYILTDRIGFISEESKDECIFRFDSLGRNIQQGSVRLLPCEALERVRQKRADELEPVRFKVAGIVTRFEGKGYLLLQRAVRVYEYENFGR